MRRARDSAAGDTPDRPDLTETRVRSEEVYSGVLLKVHRDIVRLPDGAEAVREYVRHPGAVMIVALFDDGRILLERQHRYPLGRDFLEVPAGKLEPGESALECARRELAEETGYVAAEWTLAGAIHPTIGYSDEVIHLAIARGLELREARPDVEEFLEVLTPGLDEAITMIRDGRITDAKTVAGLLWVRAFALGRPDPGRSPGRPAD